MKLYLIRHYPTGYYIPEVKFGASWTEPANSKVMRARIFPSRRSAVNFLTQWLKGRSRRVRGQISMQHHLVGEDLEKTKIITTPVHSRIRGEFSITEFEVSLP